MYGEQPFSRPILMPLILLCGLIFTFDDFSQRYGCKLTGRPGRFAMFGATLKGKAVLHLFEVKLLLSFRKLLLFQSAYF